MLERSYSYLTLRYVHDVVTGEFVNVGLVLFAGGDGAVPPRLIGRTLKRISRMRELFPDLDRASFNQALAQVDRMISSAARSVERSNLFSAHVKADTVYRSILPNSEGSLQWSSVSSGVAKDIDKAFERLFERYVTRYCEYAQRRRSDDDVWRPVRELLADRRIEVPMEAKKISSTTDSIEFSHAWKNGVWHTYEALSLDLADEGHMLEKVRKWVGNLYSVQDAREDFIPHFILGAPSNPALVRSFEKAKRILENAPNDVRVYEESEVSALVDEIGRDVAQSHIAH